MRSVFVAAMAVAIAVAVAMISVARAEEKPSGKSAAAQPAASKSAKPAAAKSTKPAPSKSKAAANGSHKTLEATRIEGEVRLPEVLFITSRDVERPLDELDAYLRAEEAQAASLDDAPIRVHVVSSNPPASPPLDPSGVDGSNRSPNPQE